MIAWIERPRPSIPTSVCLFRSSPIFSIKSFCVWSMRGTYCLYHRGYKAHSCPAAGDKDFQALICPLCKKTVRFASSRDPNEEWDLRARTSCNLTNHESNPKRKRCAAPGCREVLGPTNKHRCPRCAKETCLAHRFPDSHNCAAEGRMADRPNVRRGQAKAAAGTARKAQQSAGRPMSLREKVIQRAHVSQDPDNTLRGSVDRRRRATGSDTADVPAVPPTSAASGTSAWGGWAGWGGTESSNGGSGTGDPVERCVQCGACFRDVGELISHVESFHSQAELRSSPHLESTPARRGRGHEAGEICPLCGASFADTALLSSHVEVAHPDYGEGAAAAAAAAAAGGGGAAAVHGSSSGFSDAAKSCIIS